MLTILFVLGVFGIQFAIFLALEFIGVELALSLHGFSCLAIGLSALCLRKDTELRSYIAHLALWSFVAGPFGFLITTGIRPVRSLVWTRTDEGERSTFLELKNKRIDNVFSLVNGLLDRRIKISNPVLPAPLIEVFFDGSQNEKFDALNLIGRRFDPSLLPVLQVAMNDSDLSVRVLAGTIKSKLQKKISECASSPTSG